MKLLLRRREVADILGYSQSQILKFERAGLLRPVSAPGLRSIRYDAKEFKARAAVDRQLARRRRCSQRAARVAIRGDRP